MFPKVARLSVARPASSVAILILLHLAEQPSAMGVRTVPGTYSTPFAVWILLPELTSRHDGTPALLTLDDASGPSLCAAVALRGSQVCSEFVISVDDRADLKHRMHACSYEQRVT